MSTGSVNRDASATIQGFLYQFDATILSLLELKEGDFLTVEGIEDFDVFSRDMSEVFQCKYYEATRLTPSTIRDAIMPMLKGFLGLKSQERTTRRFHLYGYFKDSAPGKNKALSVDEIKKSLIRIERGKGTGTPHSKVINVQKELGATDQDILEFSAQLTIHITERYAVHRQMVIEALKKCCKTTALEAESFLYPSARTLVSGIAARKYPAGRQLTKAKFIALITPSRALYNAWSLRELGEGSYCSSLRSRYFSQQNIDAAHRVFVIDAALTTNEAELVSVCHELRRKWSSHRTCRKPNGERYAPFVFFRGLSVVGLVSLKLKLHQDGVRFADGYAFLGSAFNCEELRIQQTYSNQLSLRIISCADDFASTSAAIKGHLIIYDFFRDTPITPSGNGTHISIPVTSVPMIEGII